MPGACVLNEVPACPNHCPAHSLPASSLSVSMRKGGVAFITLSIPNGCCPSVYFTCFDTLPLSGLIVCGRSRACEWARRQGVFGAGAHSDYGMLTLLRTDASPGLQVQPQPGDPWHPVAPKEGAYIINLGDMLERCVPCARAPVCSRCSGDSWQVQRACAEAG